LWRSGETKPARIFDTDKEAAQDVAFSRDGSEVAIIGASSLTIWTPLRNEPAFAFTGSGDQDMVSVAISPDGKDVLTVKGKVDEPNTVNLWHVGAKDAVRTFKLDPGHVVVEAAFSPDGSMIAVAKEYSIHLWRTGQEQEAEIQRFDFDSDDWIAAIGFSKDGTALIVGDVRGGVTSWPLSPILLQPADRQVEQACALLKHIGVTQIDNRHRIRFRALRDLPSNPCEPDVPAANKSAAMIARAPPSAPN
jgi:WD40 repeat protein